MTYNYRADNSGRIPAVGDFVAYNYSGQIATGYIERIGQGRRGKIFYIRQETPDTGHLSRVQGGPKCLLVLAPAEKKPLFIGREG